jgi:enamine deaminase RidA (YjgF/YER057c/UK114 family)
VASLAFLSHSGPNAVEQLQEELARRELALEDLLRLRLFAGERAQLVAMMRELERRLPRSQWPALSAVELAADRAAAPVLDAIAAAHAHETRLAVHADGTTLAARAHEAPEAMRFGPWLFLGAVAARSPRGADLPERIKSESHELFARIEQLLQAGGTELRHVVKVGGWLSFSMSDYEPLGNVRNELLERSGLLPASAAVQTGPIFALAPEGRDVDSSRGAPLLSFEAIAYVPQRMPPEPPRQALVPAVPSPLAPYYASARRAGDYVFTCGEIPRTPAHAAHAAHEVSDICEQLHVHLAEHGALPQDVVQQTVFVRHSKDLPAIERELAGWLRTDGVVTTVVPALDMGFRPGVNVEVEMVAAIPPAARA